MTQNLHPLLRQYQQGTLSIDDLMEITGRTRTALNYQIHYYCYTKQTQWSPEMEETLLWLSDTQAHVSDVAKGMEWFGWGKLTRGQIYQKRFQIRRKQGGHRGGATKVRERVAQ